MEHEIKDKIDWLKKEIAKHITSFSKNRTTNKNKAFKVHITTTFLGAIITVLLGLNIEKLGLEYSQIVDDLLRMCALILGAIITTYSAFNAFFDHKSLWVNYTKARNQLYNLKANLEYYLAGKENYAIDEIDSFKKQLDDILEEANQEWNKLRKNEQPG